MIALHFVAFAFAPAPSPWGGLASFVGITTLACGGLLFMWSAVPDRNQPPSRWMLVVLLSTYTLYLGLLVIAPAASWALAPAAVLIGALPLVVALFSLLRFHHVLRWAIVALSAGLSIFLLMFQNRPGNGITLAWDAVLFTVYFSCAIHFWYTYRRATAGALITIAGFVAWAGVFVASPYFLAFFSGVHLESEVWNLPKFVVAVGMILLLLEDQLEHNKYLALHDELTGLPNRRLFQDRLTSTIERARRTGAQAALLLIDLDNFKLVNDSAGHHTGDELLKHVGNLFLGRVRRSDTVARTGGDEFSIILEEPMSRSDAVRVGQTLAQILEEPFACGEHTVRVGASVGIAVFPDDAHDAESLRIAADVRMYAGKNAAKVSGSEQHQPLPVKQPPQREPSPAVAQRARNLQTAE